MSVFNIKNKKNQLDNKLFFDETVTVARYDIQKYPIIEKMTDRERGFFWRPEEVVLTKDINDFRNLTPYEQHIFTSNLKRQIILDSVQGRAPALAFLPIVSLPELETWILTWSFFETIHSLSYTHIIQTIYSSPTKVLNEILDIKEVVDCANDISVYYDALIKHNARLELSEDKIVTYEHKKALWMALHAVNALEGIRFYVSFACSWAFAELKKMEGNAKIIQLIAFDENVHLAVSQNLLRLLPKDDPDFIKIKEETADETVALYLDVINQEKTWAKYLFKDGSIIGLNEPLLVDYVEWIGHKRMLAVDVPSPFKGGSNPLPWTTKWLGGNETQIANQETENTSYTVGDIDMDITDDFFDTIKF